MDLYDQHVHSRHSFDSQADPGANVDRAIACGLAGLTFTEHFDTHPDDWTGCTYDDEAYSATISRLRTDFGDAVFIGKGIEVCYQPDRMDFVLDFLQRHDFDMVMLSVHYFGSLAVYRRENWTGLDTVTGTRSYLETVLDAARFCQRLHQTHGRVFDVLGHLDLVKRYTQRFFDAYDISRFDDLLDEILRTCIAADLVPEVNTSTLRQELAEPMPDADTVTRYARLGGETMSLGSDAHRPEDVGAGFEWAATMLRKAGFHHTSIFKERRQVMIPID
ncbi:MAG: histidinol-phosphatase HisJ family protein [Phycisphaerales bacterium]|nr:MAG: histidinol-phosphatase HisJ family protein [Phycisphaerales bacterium]